MDAPHRGCRSPPQLEQLIRKRVAISVASAFSPMDAHAISYRIDRPAAEKYVDRRKFLLCQSVLSLFQFHFQKSRFLESQLHAKRLQEPSSLFCAIRWPSQRT